jgi:hypothetical protein
MIVAEAFKQFCNSILLDTSDMEISAEEIAKKLNKYYYDLDNTALLHQYIVGSVGRNTAISNESDLDIIFDLPVDLYSRYNAYESNGQSALLQEVKNVLLERYPRTSIKGDGQVVVIEFNKYTVELVPAFKQNDGKFKYPNANNGGSWKITDPISEQEECTKCEQKSSHNYYNFCRLIRAWRNNIGIRFGGLLIDTLVYNHFKNNGFYSANTYDKYKTILLELFDYLRQLDTNQSYWLAVGSGQQVNNTDNGSFIKKAEEAYNKLKININSDKLGEVLINLFGKNFPTSGNILESSYSNGLDITEQWIENLFEIKINGNFDLECVVYSDGFRPILLHNINNTIKHKSKLVFTSKNINISKPYDIYWKVKNIGGIAEKRNMLRGQIIKTNDVTKKEPASFYGPHYVECYIVKNNICVARARIDVNIGYL